MDDYTYLYDVNEILIDKFYHIGIDDKLMIDYNALFLLNYNLSKRNIETLFGPSFDDEGNFLDVMEERFAIGIYLTKSSIDNLPENFKPKFEINLRGALEKLHALHGYRDNPLVIPTFIPSSI